MTVPTVPVVRQATRDEITPLVSLVASFQAEVSPGLTMHARTCGATLAALMASDHGYVSVLDANGLRGLLVGAASPSPWVPELAVEELIWWIDPALRGRFAGLMFDDFEAWTGRLGAGLIGASDIGKSAAAFYRRRGFARAETKYFKVL